MDQLSLQSIAEERNSTTLREDIQSFEEEIGTDMDKERTEINSGSRNIGCSIVKKGFQQIPEPIKSSITPPLTCRSWLEFLMVKVPIIQWVWTYKMEYFISDIVAGITVAILHVPQGLAYALLANVPPVYGLYCAFIAPLVYAVVGTSKHLSVGTFAVIQLIVGNTVESVLVGFKDLQNCTVSASDYDNDMDVFFQGQLTTCDAVKADTVLTLAFLSGIIMFVMGLFMMGFVTIFLSEPLVSGYTTGAAVHVFNSQLQHITGLGSIIAIPPGIFRIPKTWIAMLENLGSINWVTLIISVVAIIALVIFKVCNSFLLSSRVQIPIKIYQRQERKWVTKKYSWPFPIPAALLVIIMATLISYYGMFDDKFEVAPVGNVPNGLPGTSLPNIGLIPHLIQDAFVISIISFSISVSISKVAAKDLGYTINSNQEFLALGVTNIFGSFFNSFSASGSLSRTSIQMSAGGKTQLTSILASGIVLVVLLRFGSLFEPLPKAILASMIWVSLINMFKKFKDLYDYSKISVWDGVVWITVFLATTLLGVELGLAVGVGFSLLVILLRIILPSSTTVSHIIENDESFSDVDDSRMIFPTPGIQIFRFHAPLCFINSTIFRQRLEQACNIHTNGNVDWETEGCLQTLFYKCGVMKRDVKSLEDIAPQLNGTKSSSNHTVIIDCSSINFLDSVGMTTIVKIIDDFHEKDIQVLLANLTKGNLCMLEKSEFLQNHCKEWQYPSVKEALRHAQYESIMESVSASNYHTMLADHTHLHNTIANDSISSSQS